MIAISGAETYRALQERIQALGRRNSEYGERIEQQAATIDVLKAMSTSPGDPQPVFDLIVRRSTELCSVPAASLLEYDCDGRSYYNIETVTVPGSLEAARRQYPMPPTRGSINCRAILDRQIVHIRDMRAEIDLLDSVRALGHQSQVSVPLMRGNAAIGVISLGAHAPAAS